MRLIFVCVHMVDDPRLDGDSVDAEKVDLDDPDMMAWVIRMAAHDTKVCKNRRCSCIKTYDLPLSRFFGVPVRHVNTGTRNGRA